jgi:hypothetical protein
MIEVEETEQLGKELFRWKKRSSWGKNDYGGRKGTVRERTHEVEE